MQVFEKGFNYSQDGPGNRLVYHLSGCNLQCPWCSNPEGMSQSNKAVSYTAEAMANEIISCMPMFFDGGGVTFTGGECSLWQAELEDVIKQVRAQGVSVAIESNASTPEYIAIAQLCDYVITDFKHPIGDTLKNVTGADIAVIKQNIESILRVKPLHLRVPFIHGFNDDENSVLGFIKYFVSLKSISKSFDVEILPYHEYGKEKWQSLQREYTVKNGFVTPLAVEEFQKLLQNNGIKTIKT